MKKVKAYTIFMRVLLVALAAMCLLMSLIKPLPGLIGAALSVFVFIKMPQIAKASFEAKWARESAMRSADLDDEDEGDEDEDDFDDDNDLAYQLSQKGDNYEKAGDVGNAVLCYELALDEHADMPHPYLRLAVIYKKQHRWEDVVRVCDAAIVNLRGSVGKYCQPEEYEKRKAYALEKLGADRS